MFEVLNSKWGPYSIDRFANVAKKSCRHLILNVVSPGLSQWMLLLCLGSVKIIGCARLII